MTNKQRADLTFKDNRQRGRHGWVRLTPAYSVRVVTDILAQHPEIHTILEPFSGTGTTGLVAAQAGLYCDLMDINPFLVWLARVKCAFYTPDQIERTRSAADSIVSRARSIDDLWYPPISNIERWWSPDRLTVLAKIFAAIDQTGPEHDLLLVAFCRLLMQWSNAAFNHQSMSFKADGTQIRMFEESEEIYQSFVNDVHAITASAAEPVAGSVRVLHGDSRRIQSDRQYDAVITSPPYVNRMSYIRELRPYMYWLGYLKEAREAGELDWQAIGGTWGIATSRLNDWKPDGTSLAQIGPLVDQIAQSSAVLSRYVHRYFIDMASHFASLRDVVAPGGRLFYIVGNSKFYDTLVPAEKVYADLMAQQGFTDIHIDTIRKRNSKKELYEYLVSARN